MNVETDNKDNDVEEEQTYIRKQKSFPLHHIGLTFSSGYEM